MHTMHTTVLFRLLWPLVALAGLMVARDTCGYSETKVIVLVQVFEDLNANGNQDPEEPFMPHVLVVPEIEAYGWVKSLSVSNDNGEAAVNMAFKTGPPRRVHITVVSPCGYRPTTETRFVTDQSARYLVGFVPEAPRPSTATVRPGTATIRFHLWEDRDGDKRQDTDEADLSEAYFAVFLKSQEQAEVNRIGWGQVTDVKGQAMLNLGSFCGTVWVELRGTSHHNWVTTIITPSGTIEAKRINIPYDLGTTHVEWGWREGR